MYRKYIRSDYNQYNNKEHNRKKCTMDKNTFYQKKWKLPISIAKKCSSSTNQGDINSNN